MFFFFIFIPASLLYLSVVIICINFFAKGLSLLKMGATTKDAKSKRSGTTAIIYSLLVLAIASWLYWQYAWIW